MRTRGSSTTANSGRAASTGSRTTSPTSRDSSARRALSRLISAPRALVFQAFTDAEMISNWWGPNGFRTTTVSKEVRPGGAWKFTMHGPDGTDYPNHIVYTKVVPNERLEWDHGSKEGEVLFKAVVTFADEAGKTRVTLQHTLPTVEAREQAAKYAIEGGKQTLARLEQHLVAQQ